MTDEVKNATNGNESATDTRQIVVSLPKHEITISQDGAVVRTITEFSTGRAGHLTPLIPNGKLDPVLRQRMHYSSKYKDKSGKGAAMPFALFFAGGSGCAFHTGDPDTESHGLHSPQHGGCRVAFQLGSKHEVGLQILGPNPHVAAVKQP